MARPDDLEPILQLVTRSRNGSRELALLGLCSKFDGEVLRPKSSTIITEFLHAFASFKPSDELRVRLESLTVKVTCQKLICGLHSQFPSLCLDHGQGHVAARALETYAETDDHLTQAYLAFARRADNVQAGSCCIAGLIRCAQGGNAQSILSHILRTGVPGYEELLRSGLLLEILGGPADVVHGLCNALEGVSSPNEKDRLAPIACEGLLRIAIGHECQGFRIPKVEDLMEEQGHRAPLRPEVVERLTSALESSVVALATLDALANRCSDSTEAPGAVALACALLTVTSAISQIFVERLLHATSALRLDAGGFCAENLPIASIEEVLWTQHELWLRANLARYVTTTGGLNRYVVDLMRRRRIDFHEACQLCLNAVAYEDDIHFVFESLALGGDEEALREAVKHAGFVSQTGQADEIVRRVALETVANLAKATCVSGQTAEFVLSHVHARFLDTLQVRLAAYICCEAVASPISIRSLKDRLRSEKDTKARERIVDALGAIRTALIDAPPDVQDSKACEAWLDYVGTLADASLVSYVKRFLCPPHADANVLSSALRCLESIGDASGIEVIDEFECSISPSGDLLRLSRHGRAKLLNRKDIDLLDALSDIFTPESPVFDLDINYVLVFGPGRVTTLAEGMKKATRLLHDSHWEEAVTKVNGLCESMTRAVFKLHYQMLGLSEERALKLAAREHVNRLRISEFKQLFPSVQPAMEIIRELRQEASAAHLENIDGTSKSGVEESSALRSLEEFKALFPDYVKVIQSRIITLSGPNDNRARGNK